MVVIVAVNIESADLLRIVDARGLCAIYGSRNRQQLVGASHVIVDVGEVRCGVVCAQTKIACRLSAVVQPE